MPNLKVICCKQKHIYNPEVYNSVPILVFFLRTNQDLVPNIESLICEAVALVLRKLCMAL